LTSSGEAAPSSSSSLIPDIFPVVAKWKIIASLATIFRKLKHTYGFIYGDEKKVNEIMRWVGHHTGVIQNNDVVTDVAAQDLRQVGW
jgi:hypothetical protein